MNPATELRVKFMTKALSLPKLSIMPSHVTTTAPIKLSMAIKAAHRRIVASTDRMRNAR